MPCCTGLVRVVIKLLKPFCVFTHKLEADIPYLSQLLPIWHILLKHAEEWVLEVSHDNPQWTLGVLDLLRERQAKGYWPVMPAAYMLDGEKEDAITTVVRLSMHLRPDLTDSQVKQAVQRERAKMLIYTKANAGPGARRSTEAQLLARMGE
ncbi:hypothetical protein HaLaN_01956 [Haematococcus lacustris]|uniref:Uncharacterized protein n=1 Tax=Haematococcus lacustris TaxID=44745 RepID=A0A699YAK7_HAELA|nr:hypothetical protein HaLaN_01956 [Haematococcus lacustris]